MFVKYPADQVSLGHHEVTEYGLLKQLVSVASLAAQGWDQEVAKAKQLQVCVADIIASLVPRPKPVRTD